QHGLNVGDTLTLISPEGPATIFGSAPRIRGYKVVAIFDMGMSEYDKGVVYMPFAAAQEYFVSEDGASAIEVMVDKPDNIDAYISQWAKAMGPGLQLVSWKSSNASIVNALSVERNVMFLILTLIILVAALNIISGLIMLVKDKGGDIAILRTMGAGKGSIQRIFFMTGAAIGVTGTIAGVGLGVVICLNIEKIRQFMSWLSGKELFSSEVYYLSQLPADMDVGETVLIALMALALSFVATLYPSWRAARLDPVEALRYE
ncbi:MAG TPA: FtsX-like permease family protein, partial [Rhizobiales bacterium]|nr:FtsX-like permease family protein [Hyphomicrobiales bacterium]